MPNGQVVSYAIDATSRRVAKLVDGARVEQVRNATRQIVITMNEIDVKAGRVAIGAGLGIASCIIGSAVISASILGVDPFSVLLRVPPGSAWLARLLFLGLVCTCSSRAISRFEAAEYPHPQIAILTAAGLVAATLVAAKLAAGWAVHDAADIVVVYVAPIAACLAPTGAVISWMTRKHVTGVAPEQSAMPRAAVACFLASFGVYGLLKAINASTLSRVSLPIGLATVGAALWLSLLAPRGSHRAGKSARHAVLSLLIGGGTVLVLALL
jgi:hypothetical protein